MSTDLDTEVAGTVMLLELVLVLGFTVPMLLPVAAAAMALHAIAFEINVKYQGAVLMHEARPPIRYLHFSLLLGAGLVLWMFAECGWAGRFLVFVGMPLSGVLGGLTPELLRYLAVFKGSFKRRIDAPGLQGSLLDGIEEEAAESEQSGRAREQIEHFDVEVDHENVLTNDFCDFQQEW